MHSDELDITAEIIGFYFLLRSCNKERKRGYKKRLNRMRLEFSALRERYSWSRDLIATKAVQLKWVWRPSGIKIFGANVLPIRRIHFFFLKF